MWGENGLSIEGADSYNVPSQRRSERSRRRASILASCGNLTYIKMTGLEGFVRYRRRGVCRKSFVMRSVEKIEMLLE